MATLLLIFIFLSYIGLGTPDSMFGPCWPVIMEEFSLPISYQNFVTVITALSTTTASIFSVKIVNRFGTGKVTAFSTLLTALGLLGFSFSNSFIFLCLLSVPMGLGAGAIDAALNNYVSLNYDASKMCFMHAFYGIGVVLSPFLLSFTLKNNDWRLGYRSVFIIQITLAAICFLALPLWMKKEKENKGAKNDKPILEEVKFSEVFKNNSVRIGWLAFFSSCALEFTCGQWGSTFLVKSRGFNVDYAALFTTFYYLGITLSRLLSAFTAKKISSWNQIVMGQIVVFTSLVFINLPISPIVNAVAIAGVGLGNGTFFPNLTHLTPINYGKRLSPTIVGTQQAASNLGVLIGPMLCGFLSQYISPDVFSAYTAVLGIILFFSTAILITRLKTVNKLSNREFFK